MPGCSAAADFGSSKPLHKNNLKVGVDRQRFRIRIHPSPDPVPASEAENTDPDAINLSLRLHNGRPRYRTSLQSSKENILHFYKLNFITFFCYL
jgi:hypothetical protein